MTPGNRLPKHPGIRVGQIRAFTSPEGRYYSALSGVEIDLKTALELAAIDKAAELSG